MVSENRGLLTPNIKYIDNLLEESFTSHPYKWFIIVIALAMGNAADAVEIMCVSFMLNELDDSITSSEKGNFTFLTCCIKK